jgi:hypothetical protein
MVIISYCRELINTMKTWHHFLHSVHDVCWIVFQDIQLRGLGILPEHCTLEIIENEVFATPMPNARWERIYKVPFFFECICHIYNNFAGFALPYFPYLQHYATRLCNVASFKRWHISFLRTCRNGVVVTEKTLLHHGDRILWGNNHFFRINCPRPPGAG